MSNPVVEIKWLRKSFGTLEVLKGVDFNVNESEVVCLIGSSGSGKSTYRRVYPAIACTRVQSSH